MSLNDYIWSDIRVIILQLVVENGKPIALNKKRGKIKYYTT